MKLTPAQRAALTKLGLNRKHMLTSGWTDGESKGKLYDGDGVSLSTVRALERLGLVTVHQYSQRGEYYYDHFARTNLFRRDSRHWTATLTDAGREAVQS